MNILLLLSAAKDTVANPEKFITDGHLAPKAEEGTYEISKFIMDIVQWVLGIFGFEHHPVLETWIYAIIVFFIALAVGIVIKWIVFAIVNAVGRHWNNTFYSYLKSEKFFEKACRIIPPIVFLIFITFTLKSHDTLALWLAKLTWIYICVCVVMAINTFINVVWLHVDERENKKKLPLKGLVQLVKGLIWIVAAIIIGAILLNKSPNSLLAGLGAFAAVLMLVFKDSILGVVAGVQLSENDSLHVGDWIKVNGTDANGSVLEVSLTSVKIENWDKTITTLPPYQLVSGSFTNYRNMQESNTRRILRTYMIDADSVVPLDNTMLQEFRKLPYMDHYISVKISQYEAGKVENVNNSAGLVDGTIETNLGLFRAYMQMYLNDNPHIDKESTSFVTTLQQTASGIPLQIYCFTNTSAWLPYEAIQAAVFEHLAVMLAKFGLYVFEGATGRDTIIEGYMSNGKLPSDILGIPYPFYLDKGMPQAPGADVARTAMGIGTDASKPSSSATDTSKGQN